MKVCTLHLDYHIRTHTSHHSRYREGQKKRARTPLLQTKAEAFEIIQRVEEKGTGKPLCSPSVLTGSL